jgi:hypothetical protein
MVVTRNGQLGYARLNGIPMEMLAACLAQLVGAPVPRTEKCRVEGVVYAVQDMHSCSSRPLAPKGQPKRESLNPPETAAVKRASGLLAFLPWISATDHLDDTNLIVDLIGADLLRVRAVDFEFAFAWSDEPETIKPYAPHSIVNNREPALVENCLQRIEALTTKQIAACVEESGFSPQVTEILHVRQGLIRPALDAFGWLQTR